MALPPPKRVEMGHFTEFCGEWNYPQSSGTRPDDVGSEYTCFMRGVKTHVFMDDFLVVKSQATDIVEVIVSEIRRQNVSQRLWSNRNARGELLSTSEAHWSTT